MKQKLFYSPKLQQRIIFLQRFIRSKSGLRDHRVSCHQAGLSSAGVTLPRSSCETQTTAFRICAIVLSTNTWSGKQRNWLSSNLRHPAVLPAPAPAQPGCARPQSSDLRVSLPVAVASGAGGETGAAWQEAAGVGQTPVWRHPWPSCCPHSHGLLARAKRIFFFGKCGSVVKHAKACKLYSRIRLIRHRLIRHLLISSPLSIPEKRFVHLIRHLQFRFWCLSN